MLKNVIITMNYILPGDKIVEVGDLLTLSETIDWGLIDFSVPKLWEKNKGDNITILVVDTGIAKHDDLNDNILWDKNKSFIEGEDVNDGMGHGTMVAGIIAAKDSGYGIIGVAPHAKIIAVKALSNKGMTKNSNSLELALQYALEIKPDIINMSLGGPNKQSSNFQNLLQELYNINIPVICAMGNSGTKFACYPAQFPQTIGVTAYQKNRTISNFSSRSLDADFALPGEEILTTALNNQYATVKGTSFAAPFLSGIVAIILSEYKKQNKTITVNDLKEILIKATEDAGPSGKDEMYGYGIINTNALLNII